MRHTARRRRSPRPGAPLLRATSLAAAASLAAGASIIGGAVVVPSAGADTVVLPSVTPSWAAGATVLGSTPDSQTVRVLLSLALPDAPGLATYFRQATTPGTAEFRDWLTHADFEARFAPTAATRAAVLDALSALGVSDVTTDAYGMTVMATMPASVASTLFGVHFEQVSHDGTSERVALGSVTLPAGLAGSVVGVSGLSQELEFPMIDTGQAAWPQLIRGGSVQTTLPSDPNCVSTYNSGASGPVLQDAPYVLETGTPTSSYYGQLQDTAQPTYTAFSGDPSTTKPDVVGGYTPAQLRGAYGVAGLTGAGGVALDGTGVSIGIVDAYDGPVVCNDLTTFSAQQNLATPTYSDLDPSLQAETDTMSNNLLDPAGWEGEQTLDVEAVHQMAPGASIVYSGAAAPEDPAFEQAIYAAAADGVDQVSNSYGGSGDTDQADETAWDTMAMAIGLTGTGLEASSGDDADNVAANKVREADFPATSPYTVAVGGTGLEVGSADDYEGEFYWGTYVVSKSGDGKSWDPTTATADGGGGGGVSSLNAEPSFQVGVVPTSETTNADTGTAGGTGNTVAGRVVPDVSMLGDPATGIAVGETQLNEAGTAEAYSYYRIGGTSVSSPLFTGVLALADQAAGKSIGFADPALYAIYSQHDGAFHDPTVGRPTGTSRLGGSVASPNLTPVVSEIRYDHTDSEDPASAQVATLRFQGVLDTLDDLPGYDDSTGLGTPAAGVIVGDLATAAGSTPVAGLPEAPLPVLLVLTTAAGAAMVLHRRSRRRTATA